MYLLFVINRAQFVSRVKVAHPPPSYSLRHKTFWIKSISAGGSFSLRHCNHTDLSWRASCGRFARIRRSMACFCQPFIHVPPWALAEVAVAGLLPVNHIAPSTSGLYVF